MDVSLSYSCPSGLAAEDPEPVAVLNPQAVHGYLLIADHAGNAVPKAMNSLGLDEDTFVRHIAWDPGAGAVATGLADRWQATAVLAQYSRLIVDPNRPLGEASSMPEVSDGVWIPANQALTVEERNRRAALLYWPYHTEIELQIARLRRTGLRPLVVAIHSFTSDFGDEERPWDIGVMAAADRRLGDALIASLSARGDLVIGDNQPYSGVEYGYTLKIHAGAQGLANVQIEIRQDLLINADGIARWVDIFDGVLTPLMGDQALRTIEHH
jgi:predicted N-formylglutamate amidohydrolase